MQKMLAALIATFLAGLATAHPEPDCQSEREAHLAALDPHVSASMAFLTKLDLLTDALRSYREVNRSMPYAEYQSMASDTLGTSLDAMQLGEERLSAARRYILCLRGRS